MTIRSIFAPHGASWVDRSVTGNSIEEINRWVRECLENKGIIVVTKKHIPLEEILVSSQAIKEYLSLLWERCERVPKNVEKRAFSRTA